MSRTHIRPSSRHWLAWAIVAGVCALLNSSPPSFAVEHDRVTGEPYEVLGKRIVFTTWFWVRPGTLDWVDNTGKRVYAAKEKLGPFDAQFKSEDEPRGIELVVEQPQRLGQIVKREKPWEAMGVRIHTIIPEQGKFRGWGTCQDASGKSNPCYFESSDGRNWARPNLGLIEYNGSRENNLTAFDPVSLFRDPNAPPQQRYKSIRDGKITGELLEKYRKDRPVSAMALDQNPGHAECVLGAYSADGLTWTQVPEPITAETSDGQMIGYFDQRLKKYVLYTRGQMFGTRAEGHPRAMEWRHLHMQRRSVGRTESDDFWKFPLSQVVLETSDDMGPADQFYTNGYTTIPGAPDHHLMFPSIFHQNTDTLSVGLYASYNGRNWHRVPGPAVLETAEFGQWDGGCVFAHPNLIELPDGSWAMAYSGYEFPHKYPRGAWSYGAGMIVWPKGRLVALAAKQRGEFATVTITAPGTKLLINAVTERAGEIRVEAVGLDGKPIVGRTFADSRPIIGDQHRTTVTWKDFADLGVEPGQPVALRFRLDRARIFGLEFE